MSNGNKRKDKLLGEPHGTAANRLRKAVLFKYVQLAGHDMCHRCHKKIEDVSVLSIEHKTSWQNDKDPVKSFFDLDNVAFSHLKCNVEASDKSKFICRNTGKTICDNGHELTPENTYVYDRGNGFLQRDCKHCRRDRMNRYRSKITEDRTPTPPSTTG